MAMALFARRSVLAGGLIRRGDRAGVAPPFGSSKVGRRPGFTVAQALVVDANAAARLGS